VLHDREGRLTMVATSSFDTSTLPIDDEVMLWLSPGDPRRASLAVSPFDFFERLRRHDPVYETLDGRWLISGYAESRTLLANRSGLSHGNMVAPEDQELAHRIFMNSMLFQDPPLHTRLRRVVAPAFSPRAIDRLRESVATYAHELLEPLRDVDNFEFLEGPAFRLPVLVMADLLGVPAEDFEQFRVWPETLLYLDEHPHPSPETMSRFNQIAQEALDYFNSVIEERRRNPGEDIISVLLEAETSEAALSAEEIVAMCVILHIGGHTTTNSLLASGILDMMKNPDTFGILKRDPSLIALATEEMFRCDAPVGVTVARSATTDIEVEGKTIPEGAVVHAILGAANRDPRQFHDAQRFDIRRDPNDHIAFAGGNHICIGAHLARVEVQEFLRVLVTEFPALQLARTEEDLVWLDSYIHRSVVSLPVAWV